MASKKTIKRFSGCISKSSGGCQGPIVGHWIVRWGKLELQSEVCAAHAINFVKAALINQAIRKGFAAFGSRLPNEAPKFEFKYISRR